MHATGLSSMILSLARGARRLTVCLGLIGAASSCTALGLNSGDSQRTQLEHQKAKWLRQHLSSYRYTYSVACFCIAMGGPIEIEVRGDVVVEAGYAATDQPVPTNVRDALPTVDALFRVIERAISEKADLLEVTYHPVLGYPTRIAIDHSFNADDDEVVHTITGLAPIDPG